MPLFCYYLCHNNISMFNLEFSLVTENVSHITYEMTQLIFCLWILPYLIINKYGWEILPVSSHYSKSGWEFVWTCLNKSRATLSSISYLFNFNYNRVHMIQIRDIATILLQTLRDACFLFVSQATREAHDNLSIVLFKFMFNLIVIFFWAQFMSFRKIVSYFVPRNFI